MYQVYVSGKINEDQTTSAGGTSCLKMRIEDTSSTLYVHHNDKPVILREHAVSFADGTATQDGGAKAGAKPGSSLPLGQGRYQKPGVVIDVSGRPLTPKTSRADHDQPERLPKLLELAEQLRQFDTKCKYSGRRLPKPVWPKSSPTIPSTFGKVYHEKVHPPYNAVLALLLNCTD